jgi:hypothetical protein
MSVRLVSPIGPTAIGKAAKGDHLDLADLSRGGPGVELKVQTHPGGTALSPDGRLLATFSVFGQLGLWSVPDGRELKTVDVNGDASAEARERVTKLLDRSPNDLTGNGRRAVRAVQVLERIGTPEAWTLLSEWAAGADGAVLTVAAKRTVGRRVTSKPGR